MKQKSSTGFTLLEILLAVAVLAALLTAMSVFVFSMGDIWGRNNEQRLFNQHVRAVTRHVEDLLRRAALTPDALHRTDLAVTAQEIRTPQGGTEALLTFTLAEGDRVLAWPQSALPDVVCSLAVQERQGLVLYWHSRLEVGFKEDAARLSLLSPFGTAITYDYYQPDFKTWQSLPRLQRDREGNWTPPERITLRFTHGKMTTETSVVLPATVGALPAF